MILHFQLVRLFQEDFGCTPHELFAEFDEEPVASASLAQVHRAVTHDGHNVAVKVNLKEISQGWDGEGEINLPRLLQEMLKS